MTRPRGRSFIGTQLIDKVPHGHWKTTTFLAALRTSGLTAPLVVDGPVNGEIFLAYVQQQLVPTLRPGVVVILDNLSSHKRLGIRQAIEEVGAHLIYLPPYSPDLNPIENAFSKFKWLLRSTKERTVEALWSIRGRLLAKFSEAECRNYIRHAGYRYMQTKRDLARFVHIPTLKFSCQFQPRNKSDGKIFWQKNKFRLLFYLSFHCFLFFPIIYGLHFLLNSSAQRLILYGNSRQIDAPSKLRYDRNDCFVTDRIIGGSEFVFLQTRQSRRPPGSACSLSFHRQLRVDSGQRRQAQNRADRILRIPGCGHPGDQDRTGHASPHQDCLGGRAICARGSEKCGVSICR